MTTSKQHKERLHPLLIYETGGFDPHIDANAYAHVKEIKHLTILAAVDQMSPENGGLEVVDGSHRVHVPLSMDRCIEPAWVESQVWKPCHLQPGRGDELTVSFSNTEPCIRR